MQNQSFVSRITRSPIGYDGERTIEARQAFSDQPPEMRDLLAATAGCSPYLRHLMEREQTWLREALSSAPENALKDELTAVRQATGADTGVILRRSKRRVALLTALADLGGVWPLETVTEALTDLADSAVAAALRQALAEEIRRGKVPGATEADLDNMAGMVALAMGKMGAGELNYSSDIDLICLFDETRFSPEDAMEARPAFVRATRKMTTTLSDTTSEGYVFRTDLRLRPDASVTPVCISMAAAESYYESVGRTWERAAFIKARVAAGDDAAGSRFLKVLTPFVWRKHLDFAAIQDTQDMRRRIRDHRGLHGTALEGHNMKLGLGGIREIEFFAQTRQLIAGGRDPELRSRRTVEALRGLAGKGWIPVHVCDDLIRLYRKNREVEHRLQMINDAQTHDLPSSAEGFDRLARFMGEGDTAKFRAALSEQLDEVATLTGDFFTPQPVRDGPELSDDLRLIVDGWQSYPALRSERAREIFRRLRPDLLGRLLRATNPREALSEFDTFLRGLPAGVQIFSLFEANPTLVDLIVDIVSTSPRLARYLAGNSAVLDAVIGGSFFALWPGMAVLRRELTERLAAIPDYEQKLDSARRWAKEWHFRVGVHHLRGLIDAFEAGKQYADLAEAVVAAIWPPCVEELSRRHGSPPGAGALVLGMGSLGSGRLNAASDLDLIVIYDAEGVEQSDGPRPLASRAYYAKLTQALLTALSAPMAEGRLYEVDMRLRPSGRSGPVATSIESFAAYQRDEAWTWEHLALTRARAIAGPIELADRLETLRRTILVEKSSGEKIGADVQEMRERLRAAKPGQPWDAKLGAGRMQDIELLAQTAALKAGDPARRVEAQLRAGVRSGFLNREEEAGLLAAYHLCWNLTAAARLLTDGPLKPDEIGEGARNFILRETGLQHLPQLSEALKSRSAVAAQIIDARLG